MKHVASKQSRTMGGWCTMYLSVKLDGTREPSVPLCTSNCGTLACAFFESSAFNSKRHPELLSLLFALLLFQWVGLFHFLLAFYSAIQFIASWNVCIYTFALWLLLLLSRQNRVSCFSNPDCTFCSSTKLFCHTRPHNMHTTPKLRQTGNIRSKFFVHVLLFLSCKHDQFIFSLSEQESQMFDFSLVLFSQSVEVFLLLFQPGSNKRLFWQSSGGGCATY